MASINNDSKELDSAVIKYLGLETSYEPRPSSDPIGFLQYHLTQLPQSLLLSFATITSPKQRTAVNAIRNRRFKYASSNPPELTGEHARETWKELWPGPSEDEGARIRSLQAQENSDEKAWAESSFLGGQKQHVGRLGRLLGKVESRELQTLCERAHPGCPGDYAEEREAERLRKDRILSRHEDFIPEEESDSDEEIGSGQALEESFDDIKTSFERILRERFIYGLLDVSYVHELQSLLCLTNSTL